MKGFRLLFRDRCFDISTTGQNGPVKSCMLEGSWFIKKHAFDADGMAMIWNCSGIFKRFFPTSGFSLSRFDHQEFVWESHFSDFCVFLLYLVLGVEVFRPYVWMCMVKLTIPFFSSFGGSACSTTSSSRLHLLLTSGMTGALGYLEVQDTVGNMVICRFITLGFGDI